MVRRPGGTLAAAAILLAVTAAGCGSSSYARRERGDRVLTVQVRDRLASTQALSAARIDAKSYSGVIALLGEVPDEDSRIRAEKVAGAVPGVVRVNNLILVVKSASKTEGSSPAEGALILSRAD
ncbi:MAG TPA: BON domain-containing protein [Thermoanaerobaculia bacterium]|nr:BON domain-containing protein [Thermoanaerobaculia bacterium]